MPLHPIEIFMPQQAGALQKILDKKLRFAHYTSADAGVKILNSRVLWLRSALVMNDFKEIAHGHACFSEAWDDRKTAKFREYLDSLYDGLSMEAKYSLDSAAADHRTQTYLTSFSVHDVRKDAVGRLSMWRAYGGHTNIAIVFKLIALFGSTPGAQIFPLPVTYGHTDRIIRDLKDLHSRMNSHSSYVADIGRSLVLQLLSQNFRAAVLATKHPGFEEEREWRLIYNPKPGKADQIQSDIETIGGVPQRVFKLHLETDQCKIGDTIEQIIIGPCVDALTVQDVFIDLLERANVADAAKRVTLSAIPLRR